MLQSPTGGNTFRERALPYRGTVRRGAFPNKAPPNRGRPPFPRKGGSLPLIVSPDALWFKLCSHGLIFLFIFPEFFRCYPELAILLT
jgi:hypothetical protein